MSFFAFACCAIRHQIWQESRQEPSKSFKRQGNCLKSSNTILLSYFLPFRKGKSVSVKSVCAEVNSFYAFKSKTNNHNSCCFVLCAFWFCFWKIACVGIINIQTFRFRFLYENAGGKAFQSYEHTINQITTQSLTHPFTRSLVRSYAHSLAFIQIRFNEQLFISTEFHTIRWFTLFSPLWIQIWWWSLFVCK